MKTKRLIASLLCACMLAMTCSISFASVAFAATSTGADLYISNTPSSTGITMTGTSFHVYEVFSAEIIESSTTEGEGADAVTTTTESFEYTVNAEYIDFFEAHIDDYEYPDVSTYKTGNYSNDGATDDDGNVNPAYTVALDTANNEAMEYINTFYNSNTMQALVALLRTYTLTAENSIPVKATTTTASAPTEATSTQTVHTTTGNLLGYYLVLDSTDSLTATENSSSVSAGMLCNVPARAEDGTLSANQHITIKGSAPTISKQIWDNDGIGNTSLNDGSTGAWADVADYQVGDTVEFLITATIPSDLTGYTDYTYIIEDAMTDGLDFVEGSVTIYKSADLAPGSAAEGKLHDDLAAAYYTDSSAYENDEVVLFTYKFNMLGIKAAFPELSEFYIYYKAIVTPEAKVSTNGYETNTVELIYSTNPYDPSEVDSVEDSVYSFTFDLDVLKTSGDGVTPLSGATFALYELNRTTEGSVDQLYLVYDADLSDDYETAVFYIDTTKTASSTEGVLTTNATGKFMILGLDDATTYKLVETAAPTGYNPADPITFNITTAPYTFDSTGLPVVHLTSAGSSIDIANGNLSTTIINTSSALLPSTGGMGTTLLTYGGIILMVCAGVLLFVKRKKS